MRPRRRRARRRAWREAAPPERTAPHRRQSREPRGEARSRSTCPSTGILSCEKNCEKNKTKAPGGNPWSLVAPASGATSPQKLLHQADRLDGFRLRGVHLPGLTSSLSLADQLDRVAAAGLGTCDRTGRLDILRAAAPLPPCPSSRAPCTSAVASRAPWTSLVLLRGAWTSCVLLRGA